MKTAAELGRVVRETLTAQAIIEKAEAEALRAAIRETMCAHPGPVELSAKGVLRALEARYRGRNLPKLRTVQRHMQKIRAERAPRRGMALSA